MSGYNEVMLSGFVFENPIEIENEDESYYKTVLFQITVERADVLNRNDLLTIKCYNDTAVKALKEIKEGDYFVGETIHIRTKNYVRKIEAFCPNCQALEVREINAEKTEIICGGFINMKKVFPKSLFGVNKIFLFGNACTNVEYFKFAGGYGKGQSKFKMAIDRHGKEKLAQKADYPFVVSYGYEAEYQARELERGNMLIVKGAIQERKIKQDFSNVCKACGTAYGFEVKSNIVEVGCVKSEVLKSIKGKSQSELEKEEQIDMNEDMNEEYMTDDMEEDFNIDEIEGLFSEIE